MESLGVINVANAVEILRKYGMRIDPNTLRKALEDRVFPFGDCIKMGKSNVYHVYRRSLQEWIDERVILDPEVNQ